MYFYSDSQPDYFGHLASFQFTVSQPDTLMLTLLDNFTRTSNLTNVILPVYLTVFLIFDFFLSLVCFSPKSSYDFFSFITLIYFN